MNDIVAVQDAVARAANLGAWASLAVLGPAVRADPRVQAILPSIGFNPRASTTGRNR